MFPPCSYLKSIGAPCRFSPVTLTLFAVAMLNLRFVSTANAEPVYELRTYWAAEGKMDALNARFRDHTTGLFAKHAMTNVGYWQPISQPDPRLIYVIAHESVDAVKANWKEFAADPEWTNARKESEKDGKLVAKVESLLLTRTDYSPQLPPPNPDETVNRVFELRTYTTVPGKLPALNERFRNHTMSLFAKHGMTNLIYWTPVASQKNAENTLVYLLAHPSERAGQAAFSAFRADPVWVAAKSESEAKAGGSLTVAENGVVSLYLKPTDYSPLK
jgi:hypothetical protein